MKIISVTHHQVQASLMTFEFKGQGHRYVYRRRHNDWRFAADFCL